MLYPLQCTDYTEAQPNTQNTKLKETDPMEGIRESNNKAEQRPLSQEAIKAKEKIKNMLRDTMGSDFTLSWGVSQTARAY